MSEKPGWSCRLHPFLPKEWLLAPWLVEFLLPAPLHPVASLMDLTTPGKKRVRAGLRATIPGFPMIWACSDLGLWVHVLRMDEKVKFPSSSGSLLLGHWSPRARHFTWTVQPIANSLCNYVTKCWGNKRYTKDSKIGLNNAYKERKLITYLRAKTLGSWLVCIWFERKFSKVH